MLSRWAGVFQIAAVYVGTIVGAGFATGKEIVEFFTQYGLYGFLGILIAGYLFIFIGTKMMLISSRIHAASYEEFNEYLFGKKIASIINLLFLAMLVGVSAVMLSGAGAVFEEQLGMSKHIGVWLTIVLAIAVLIFGTRGLFAINSFVVPIMISFSVLLCVLTIGNGGFWESLLHIPETGITVKVLVSPFSYTAFNLALAQAVLVPIAYEVQDQETIKRGGMLGGIFLTIILLSGHFALMTLPNIADYEIPSAIIMKSAGETLYWVFILVIYGEIFTSVIGNIFGLERQISGFWKVPSICIILLLFMIAFFISEVGYGRLIGYLYPLFGYISLLFLVLVWRSKVE
ncbi:GerAB/ArcD/ProY family transporter [Peribacillus asahii]|uniref:YkvI family membrane protein n=1 Tax=Peribacillus asahii TaxID=228899 RepID=UPI0038013424